MPYTVSELAQRLGGEVTGDGSMTLTGFAAATTARPGDLTFAESESYFAAAEQSAASAILVSGDLASTSKALMLIRVQRNHP